MYESIGAPYIRAARVPASLEPQEFGAWQIIRQGPFNGVTRYLVGADSMTVLCRHTEATLHLVHGEVVMEDSVRELRRHLPIWLAARGRVLKTGLGLGCVVRGLLSKTEVDHIDVVEIDPDIIRVIGAEFADNPRVTIHQGDALTWDYGDRRWDFAWHDIWCEQNEGLDHLHAQMLHHYYPAAARQGAWAFPRFASRIMGWQLLGAPRYRRAAA